MSDDPFMEHEEVDKFSHLSDVTRRRLEKRDRFPKRLKLSTRRTLYRRSEVEDWARDPEGWRPSNVNGDAE